MKTCASGGAGGPLNADNGAVADSGASGVKGAVSGPMKTISKVLLMLLV